MSWKARPTTYRGIAMRSRLEALVAADLDTQFAGTWEYEPRAFANAHGQYLPDFRLTLDDGSIRYLEVKPTLDAALRITERMQIIWDSEPDATLMIFIAVEGTWGYSLAAHGDSRTWRVA